jgi:hypothetical protein
MDIITPAIIITLVYALAITSVFLLERVLYGEEE